MACETWLHPRLHSEAMQPLLQHLTSAQPTERLALHPDTGYL